MSPETPSFIDNFPPNTLLAILEELLPETTSWDIATGTFDIGSLLALGELWLGITIDFMVRGLNIEDPDVSIDYVFPEEEAVLVPSPIAITKDSQNVAGAKSFVDFILSKEGRS